MHLLYECACRAYHTGQMTVGDLHLPSEDLKWKGFIQKHHIDLDDGRDSFTIVWNTEETEQGYRYTGKFTVTIKEAA